MPVRAHLRVPIHVACCCVSLRRRPCLFAHLLRLPVQELVPARVAPMPVPVPVVGSCVQDLALVNLRKTNSNLRSLWPMRQPS